MKFFLKKEWILLCKSIYGLLLPVSFLLSTSLMLWIFRGEYNIPEGGYATMQPFFRLVPLLFLLWIPALTMRLFADERRQHTLELLLFRPVHLSVMVLTKYLAACLSVLLWLLFTGVYVAVVYALSTAGLHWGEIVSGYLGLVCLLMAFSAIGLFASSLSENQAVSFLFAFVLSFFFYYGPELIAGLTSDGAVYSRIEVLGMHLHYRLFMRGVIDLSSLCYFASLSLLFLSLTCLRLSVRYTFRRLRALLLLWCGMGAFNLLSSCFLVRFDLSEGHRYTLSPLTCEMVSELQHPLKVLFYLDGDLNPGFHRLRLGALDMLENLARYAPRGIYLQRINPSDASDEATRQQRYVQLDARGMRGISVQERDREGKVSSKIVFPWMELVYEGDTLPVSLLRQSAHLSSRQLLDTSIADLEYSLADGIRVLTMRQPERIAFIEGHGEWDEPYVYQATEMLSRYYQVDRGNLQAGLESLLPYKVLLVAGSHSLFTEEEKFMIDQYLMHGGRIFFLLNGVCISDEAFAAQGESPTLANTTGLADLLFNYGVRVNSDVVQDMSCTPIRLESVREGVEDAYTIMPWYFAPLLEPDATHVITRHLSPLKSELVSTITWVGQADSLQRTVLLTTSEHAHTLQVPEAVSLRYVEMPADISYFRESHLPVAGLIEGSFSSAYRHRLRKGVLTKSRPTRILVCASSSVIRNEWQGQGRQTMPLPLGYEPINRQQLGNADFIVNAVNYLAGHEQWLNLRSRHLKLRMLNREAVGGDLLTWQVVGVVCPLALLFLFWGLLRFSGSGFFCRRC